MAKQKHLSVNADLFRIAYGAVSTEETRYYLNGVYVQPCAEGGALMVSTDGHRLLVVRDVDGFTPRPAIIRLRKDALTACKPKRDTRALHVVFGVGRSDSVATIYSKGRGEDETQAMVVNHDCEIDGTFPDWIRVVPTKFETQALAAFNPVYLAEMGKVGNDLSKALDFGSAPMVVHTPDDRGPALISWSALIPAFGVLMPMRCDMSDKPLPFWFPAPAQAKAA